MKKRHIVSAIIVICTIAVFYGFFTSSWHGNKDKWIKNHGATYYRDKEIHKENQYCLDCHLKKFKQTKANFCNKCHAERGVKPVE